MSNSYYNHSTYPAPNSPGSSAQMRAELELITAAFNKLPALSGNGNKVVVVNPGGTALIPTTALTGLTIDNSVIGATTPAAGYFTTLSATSGITGNLTGNVTGNITSSGSSSFVDVTITGSLDMSSLSVGTITGLNAPTNSSDAANKGYVDTQVATRLALAGGTMTGAIAMGTNRITGLGDPSSAQDAATKNYIDTVFGSTTSAATSAAAAAASATAAAGSATAAATAKTAAETAQAGAEAAYDSFDDRYLGAKSADPTVDNDGNALLTGALYWNTTSSIMKTWTGSAWIATYLPATGYLPLSGGALTGALSVNYATVGTGSIMQVDGGASNYSMRVSGAGAARIDLEDRGTADASGPFRYIFSDDGTMVLGIANRSGTGTTGSTAHITIGSTGNVDLVGQLRFTSGMTVRNGGNVVLANDLTQTKFGTANGTSGIFTWHKTSTMTSGDEVMRLDGSANLSGIDGALSRFMLKDQGYTYYNSGTTSALDYTNGSHQRWTPSGSATLSITNWPPSGNLGELLIEGVNLGAATITWPTVNWIKSDGTTTTTFSSNGVTLQSSGTDWVVLWTRDAGTTVYGKVIR